MNSLERQPDFPFTDLTEGNADFLREFLSQPNLTHTISPENPDGRLEEFLRQFDFAASPDDSGIEAAHELYTETHDIARAAQIEALCDGHFGLPYGYTMYEIILSLVAPNQLLARGIPAKIATHSLAAARRKQSLPTLINDSKNKLVKEQQLTAQLIGEAAAKLYVVSADDALLGAGIRRQIELDSREYTQSLVQ